jgi:DNA-binding transcriptional regulator YiaG
VTSKANSKSDAYDAIHSAAQGLHRAGTIDTATARYFDDIFLEDFQRRWPAVAEHSHVDFVRDGLAVAGAARAGNSRCRRLGCSTSMPTTSSSCLATSSGSTGWPSWRRCVHWPARLPS